jgi:hypothetical protein
MQALAAQERAYTGLARGMRAAIVLPPLFALALLVIKQPEMAGLTVFGTFAHLVMIDYDTPNGARATESATLTVLGAILLCLGTLASTNAPLAVGSAVVAGFLAEWRSLAKGHIAVIRSALLLAFMLAVAVPTPLDALPPRLCGWLLAGLLAQPALQLLWIPIQSVNVRRAVPSVQLTVNSSNASRTAISAGAAMGLALLAARLLKLEHAFWIVLGVAPVLGMWKISPAQTFWHQQAGTLVGFLSGAVLAASVGTHQVWYWMALPFAVFLAAYLSSAVGFMAGQAGFTAFAVVLFCILTPLQREVGILRVEDIAIGGAISLLVALVLRAGFPSFPNSKRDNSCVTSRSTTLEEHKANRSVRNSKSFHPAEPKRF